MSSPDAGALPPMKPSALKPSALPETDALTTTELANALDNCPTHELSMYVAIAIDRLRALAAATEDKPNYHRQMGITLLDAKYLDPACHKGCQSLVHQAKLAAATEEKDKPRWHPMEISGHDGEWFLETKGYMAGILFLNSDFTLAEARDFLARANRPEQPAESKLTELERDFEQCKKERSEWAGANHRQIGVIQTQRARIAELERENRELREQGAAHKARLDWLERHYSTRENMANIAADAAHHDKLAEPRGGAT